MSGGSVGSVSERTTCLKKKTGVSELFENIININDKWYSSRNNNNNLIGSLSPATCNNMIINGNNTLNEMSINCLSVYSWVNNILYINNSISNILI